MLSSMISKRCAVFSLLNLFISSESLEMALKAFRPISVVTLTYEIRFLTKYFSISNSILADGPIRFLKVFKMIFIYCKWIFRFSILTELIEQQYHLVL